jgi:hypothetical protein|tara:strand:- start:37738 stop:38142 length:405 start_codon:yes stop_codon:yes gene_type:complete
MPGQSDTLFDQYLALDDPCKRKNDKARIPWRNYFAQACEIMLLASRFAFSTVMITLGLPLFFFLAISGWDLAGLFAHLDNLSSRYLEADASRRLTFSSDLKWVFFTATALIAAIRFPVFFKRIASNFPVGGGDE